MSNGLTVMVKDGISYVRTADYSSTRYTKYLINGTPEVIAKGDDRYSVFEGEINKIEVVRAQNKKLVGYKLYEKYKDLTALPETLPLDAFTIEEGETNGKNSEFYHGIYEDQPPLYENIEFTVIDRNSEPVYMPDYVVVEFPNNIGKFKEVQHNYPCYVNSKIVFDMLHDKVKAKIEDMPNYEMDDYKSIQSLTVTELIPLPYHESEFYNYYPTYKSKNPKIKSRVIKHRKQTVFYILGPEYSRDNRTVDRTKVIKGENYADLQQKLEDYFQSYLDLIEDGVREVCAQCKGQGIITKH